MSAIVAHVEALASLRDTGAKVISMTFLFAT
jgi:hypothetical protein